MARLWARLNDVIKKKTGQYSDAPSSYWNVRHLRRGASLRGAGCSALDHEDNQVDYDFKWDRINEAIKIGCEPDKLKKVLDAGCGTGWFSQKIRPLCSHMTCVDFSEEGIALTNKRLEDRISGFVQPLHEKVDGAPFDLVICIDVLFHIVGNDIWKESVRNLASMTGGSGALIIQEHFPESHNGQAAEHVCWRSLEDYLDVLEGWKLIHHDHYVLPAEKNTKDLLVWKRI